MPVQQSIEAKLLHFLQLLEEMMPPADGHHNITIAGSGRLLLTVRHQSVWSTFYLDDGDIEKPAETIRGIAIVCEQDIRAFDWWNQVDA